MKIAVEYMKHLVGGVSVNPPWIIIGDFYHNNNNNTYIGVVLSKESRDYYVPSTLRIMSKVSIQDRNVLISGLTDNDNLSLASIDAQEWWDNNISE